MELASIYISWSCSEFTNNNSPVHKLIAIPEKELIKNAKQKNIYRRPRNIEPTIEQIEIFIQTQVLNSLQNTVPDTG